MNAAERQAYTLPILIDSLRCQDKKEVFYSIGVIN